MNAVSKISYEFNNKFKIYLLQILNSSIIITYFKQKHLLIKKNSFYYPIKRFWGFLLEVTIMFRFSIKKVRIMGRSR